MRRIIQPILAAVLGVAFVANVWAAQQAYPLAPGDSLHVTCMSELMGTVGHDAADLVCATLVPTPTATTAPVTGWHPPTTHEHGDAPPQWVLDSGQQPFTQTRESHVGYKGVLASMPNGVQSYFVNHILSTVMARSHGDHDYQLWVRDRSGNVSYWQGMMDFGTPPPLRTTDTGQRPIIQSIGDGGCETWYSRPGAAVMDVGLTICGRYESFAGAVLGGNGTFRTSDWALYPDRFAGSGGHVEPTLARDCAVEFGICRFRFLVDSKQYPGPSVVPIN